MVERMASLNCAVPPPCRVRSIDLGSSTSSNNRLKDGRPGGFGAAVTKGTLGGAKSHTLVLGELAKHSHELDFPEPLVKGNLGGTGTGTPVMWEPDPEVDPTKTKVDGGNDEAHNNVQPTMLLNALIKL